MKAAVRTQAQRTLTRLLSATGSLRRAERSLASSDAITVLTLHRIVPDAEVAACRSPRGMVLRESLFRSLIEFLNRHADVVDPHNVSYEPSNRNRPRVLLTFDDGWADNAEIAQPHLARVGVPACFFIATTLVGQAHPFWPERVQHILDTSRRIEALSRLDVLLSQLATETGVRPPQANRQADDEQILTWFKQFSPERILTWAASAETALSPQTSHSPNFSAVDERERMMTWQQLRSLVASGHMLGSHTATHALLPSLSGEQQASELVDSRSALLDHITQPQSTVSAISYPNGSVTADVARAASRAGYRLGFTTALGVCRSATDQLLLPRINVWDGKLTSIRGRFSEDKLRYSLFWQPRRAAA